MAGRFDDFFAADVSLLLAVFRTDVLPLAAVFRAVVDLDFLAAAGEWEERAEEAAVDWAASAGTDKNSDSTTVRQSAAGRAAGIRGTRSIMFSLYAHFAQALKAGTTSVTTRKRNGRLAADGQFAPGRHSAPRRGPLRAQASTWYPACKQGSYARLRGQFTGPYAISSGAHTALVAVARAMHLPAAPLARAAHPHST